MANKMEPLVQGHCTFGNWSTILVMLYKNLAESYICQKAHVQFYSGTKTKSMDEL